MCAEKSAYLSYRILEFCLGAVCFGLFTYYFIDLPESIRYWSYYNWRTALVQYGIAFVAADAFPFLVQIPFLIAYGKHGRSFQHNILNPIANLVGAIVYTTTGGLSLSVAYSSSQLAVGSMFTVTGIIYFFDLCYWMKRLRKAPEQQLGGGPSGDQLTNQSPPPNMPLVQIFTVDPNRNGQPMSQQSNANPNQQYNANPNQQYNANPNQQYNANPNQQYNANPNQQYNANPNQQYNADFNQPNNVDPNQQNNAIPSQQFNANPNQQYTATNPNQQYGAGHPIIQQFIAVPNQQINPPMVQPNTIDQSHPYSAPIGQQQ